MGSIKDVLFSSVEKQMHDLCLVIIPFSKEFDGVYSCIKRAVESETVGMKCIRANEMNNTKSVIDDIIELIKKSHIIVSDVTGLNPNVLYELGISHSVKDKVILLTQDTNSLPFDFRHLRAIEYTNDIEGGFSLVKKLESVLSKIKNESTTPFPSIHAPPSILKSGESEEIEIIHGSANCLNKLVEELHNAREKYGEQTAIIRALPVEFTEEIYGSRINDKISNKLQEYKDFIRNIVQEGSAGVDNWDYTVYGRVFDPDLNKATVNFINEVYFSNDEIPDTSEIGVDDTWNHVGFFVLGKTHGSIAEFVADTSFIIYGEPTSLRPESASIVRNAKFSTLIVRRWYETLKQDSLHKNLYWNMINDTKGVAAIETIKQKISRAIIEG